MTHWIFPTKHCKAVKLFSCWEHKWKDRSFQKNISEKHNFENFWNIYFTFSPVTWSCMQEVLICLPCFNVFAWIHNSSSAPRYSSHNNVTLRWNEHTPWVIGGKVNINVYNKYWVSTFWGQKSIFSPKNILIMATFQMWLWYSPQNLIHL